MRKMIVGICLGGLLISVAPAYSAEDVSGASTIGGPATKHHGSHMRHKKMMKKKTMAQ